MDGQEALAERFEAHRDHLRGVAFRMLGSADEADDAVQSAWFRVQRADMDEVDNLAGWLTTVVGRICLDILRARRARGEVPLLSAADTVLQRRGGIEPEQEAELAESVGFALLAVLDRLTPAERVVFVLHDVFEVPFDEISRVVDRSAVATRKLASRAAAGSVATSRSTAAAISLGISTSSTRFWSPRATVIWTPWSSCWRPTWSVGSTVSRCRGRHPPRCAALVPSPRRPACSYAGPASPRSPSSTDGRASWWHLAGA